MCVGRALGTPLVFVCSSRRRHTRWTGDWSSDVCSSDLTTPMRTVAAVTASAGISQRTGNRGRSEERRVGKSVDLGGRRIIKKKKRNKKRELPKNRHKNSRRKLYGGSGRMD